MPTLNKTQSKWLESVYNRAFRESNSQEFSIRFAANLYQSTKLNPSFESGDGSRVGIAGLPANTESIDPKNTEESISFALQRDLDTYIQSNGDLDSFVQGNLPDLLQVEGELDDSLFGNEKTFTGINSQEQRLKRAMRSDDTSELGGIVDEMVKERVTSRNRVINNG